MSVCEFDIYKQFIYRENEIVLCLNLKNYILSLGENKNVNVRTHISV